MKRNSHFSLAAIAVVAALVAGAFGPYSVYADDGPPPVEPAGEEVSGSGAEGQESAGEEPVSIPEVLEESPEGTDLVVVGDSGEALPLVTQEAAEIIVSSDPMWCPDGATPGDAGCTGSFGTFDDLLDALAADAASATPVYTGNGVIWVEDAYNGNDNAQIEFDGSVLTNIGSDNLAVRGGWSGGANTTITGVSDLDVSLVFTNWGGNITLSDLTIAAGDGNGFGLLVDTDGNLSLDNVSVSNTPLNGFGFGDGAIIAAGGNVDIDDSEFDDNAGNGLQVSSGGTISLDTVSADDNGLTGAYLDTCGYNASTGLCAGNGLVTISSLTGNTFNGNGFIGLTVDAGGGVNMDHTQANTNGLDGAVITSADDDGTGNVSVSQSDFSGNANAYGLDIFTDGNITLANVTAHSNNTGAVLDTTAGTGSVNVSDSDFGSGAMTGNTWTGLHIASGGSATLVNVVASYNGTNGAYIEAQDDISVTNSDFDENVHFNFPQDPGLYAKSYGGNITLLDVTADGNDYGAGAVLRAMGAGVISVTGNSEFNGNGTFGIQAATDDGNVTLTDIEASYNQVKGAYLKAYGQGNIFVVNGLFVENGNYGLYAFASEGDITLNTVTVTGDDGVAATANDNLTDVGALLIAYGGGIFATDSAFNLNTQTGLIAVGNGAIELTNVTADHNGGNGVEVYTAQTYSCRGIGDPVVNVIVNVDGGTFTNNGGYGITATPGPSGSLVFVNPATFGGNGLGDFLLDLTAAGECPPEPVKEPKEDNPKVVSVPTPDNLPVRQECDLFTSTILELPDGTWMNVGCPFEGFSNLTHLDAANLPGLLGAGTLYVNGVIVSLTDSDGTTILNQDGTVTINFALPPNSRGRAHSVLFWDPELNDGAGGWMKLPVFEAGTSFPLHPENPADPRVIISGVQQKGNLITLTVNFSGAFVLTTP